VVPGSRFCAQPAPGAEKRSGVARSPLVGPGPPPDRGDAGLHKARSAASRRPPAPSDTGPWAPRPHTAPQRRLRTALSTTPDRSQPPPAAVPRPTSSEPPPTPATLLLATSPAALRPASANCSSDPHRLRRFRQTSPGERPLNGADLAAIALENGKTSRRPAEAYHASYSLAMAEVSIRELGNHGGEVIDRVARGEQLTVTRSGKPVAELPRCVASRWAPRRHPPGATRRRRPASGGTGDHRRDACRTVGRSPRGP